METDVVISGGGPVGLMLACELRLAGVDVLVVERLTEIDATIKAAGINVPTAESMYRRGLLPALAEQHAAHVHSPFGDQGLNLGIGDAVNLGWKLAATIRGGAPEGLLDSYTAERHPIGAWVLDWSRAQVALMRPDVRTNALRDVVTDLLSTRDGSTYLAKKLSGLLHRYPLDGDHELIGTSSPDFEFADGSRLGEHLRDGKALLLDFTASGALRDLAADRVRTLTVKCVSHSAVTGVLVRPDGIIAWAREDDGTDGLENALRTWLGGEK
ncbi:FAD-dependent monooxygenase [Amycolatopsis sp. NPDC051128]|uniref:FAD-dependent monooxygenase n=1 Tax=Amycolatopsis sp. NPDC051128 TaxID=3155412 RepID=UPI00343AA06F